MEDVSLEGKVALITGGSRGMGREMAMAFAKAGAAGIAVTAAKACAWTLEPGDTPGATPVLPVAAAKIRVGEAAAVGAGIAHQTLGAMGFTGEHILHRFTHRLWAWRDEFGSEAEWALRLGHEMLARGVDDYWPALVDQADPRVVERAVP